MKVHTTVSNGYYAAIYIRLSKEDDKEEKRVDSESVVNQKNLLLKYVNENHYHLVDLYIDDGYTGTNFDRPAFQRMIQDIELGKINMVITKDLSRLGRDYITTGEYIEKWFPKHNVRYISVLDGVDTMLDTANNEIAPFKAIINDMYSRDNSKKIRASLRSKQQEGKWVGGCPPFGYMVDPNDKNHLVVNEIESPIVRKIFALALAGKSKNQIMNILFDEHIPTPSMIRNKTIGKYATLGYWNTTTIQSILSNELYTGDMVQNRRSRISYKVRNIVPNDKSEWIIVSNTHEPLISREKFSEVQRILKVNRKLKYEKKSESILDGLIYCGECKSRIMIQRSGKGHSYTVCNTYRKYSKLKLCTAHSHNLQFLEERVMETIKKILKEYVDEEKMVDYLKKSKEKMKNESNLARKEKKIDELLETKIKTLDKIYIDKVEEKISENQYIRTCTQINEEIEKLKEEKNIILAKMNSEESFNNLETCVEFVKDFFHMKNFTRKIAVRLIQKIELHQDKTIDIYFHFRKKKIAR